MTYAEQLLSKDVFERIMKSAHHEEGDRVPIWDFIDSAPIYEKFAPGDKNPVTATAKVFKGLGIDLCRSVYLPVQEEEVRAAQQGDVTHAVEGATRWLTNRTLKTGEDLRKLDLTPPSVEDIEADEIPAFRQAQEIFAPEVMYLPCIGIGLDISYYLMGLVNFSYCLADDFEAAMSFFDYHNQVSLARAKAFAKHNLTPIAFIYDDIAYKGSLLFSPDFMRKEWLPRLKKIIEPLANAGQIIIFHSDGYLMDILDDMIDAGINGLNPIEPLAGMDIGYLKRRYGDRLILVGNVDCSQLLPFGTVEDVRQAVKECLRAAGEGGGLFIGSSSEIVPSTPVENIFAFYEACREYGKYPLKL